MATPASVRYRANGESRNGGRLEGLEPTEAAGAVGISAASLLDSRRRAFSRAKQ